MCHQISGYIIPYKTIGFLSGFHIFVLMFSIYKFQVWK